MEWRVMKRLLSAVYPLHLLVVVSKSVCTPDYTSPDVFEKGRILPQDAQNGRSARPQRVTQDDPSELARVRCHQDGSAESPTARVERGPSNSLHLSLGEWPRLPFTARINDPSELARYSSQGMAPVLVPLRPLSEHILIVRAPGARDRHGCHSTPFIVRVLRARRAPGRSLRCWRTFSASCKSDQA